MWLGLDVCYSHIFQSSPNNKTGGYCDGSRLICVWAPLRGTCRIKPWQARWGKWSAVTADSCETGMKQAIWIWTRLAEFQTKEGKHLICTLALLWLLTNFHISFSTLLLCQTCFFVLFCFVLFHRLSERCHRLGVSRKRTKTVLRKETGRGSCWCCY